jgi:predicted  nucleic acid-binding Zn-ribbon protein
MVKNLNTVERSQKIRLGRFMPDSQADNAILINATEEVVNVATSGFYVAPITFGDDVTGNTLVYNTQTKEIRDSGHPSHQFQDLQSVTGYGNVTTETVSLSNATLSLVTSGPVGVANASPGHTLSVGSNLWVDDTGSNVLVVTGGVLIEGNLVATGDTTYVESRNLSVSDPLIEIGKNNSDQSFLFDLGLIMNRPGGQNVGVSYVEGTDELILAYTQNTATDRYVLADEANVLNVHVYGDLTVSNALTAGTFYGDGQYLSNIATDAELNANVLRIDALETNLDDNSSRIATNTTDLADNSSRIATNTLDLADNSSRVTSLRTDVNSNSFRLSTLYTYHASNVLRIATLETDTSDNTARVEVLETDLADNSSRISVLDSRLSDNSFRISVNTADIASNAVRVSTLETDTADNVARISTLETDTTDNAARVTVLETDLADNNARVTTLESDLADNNARVSTLETYASSNNARVTTLETDLADNAARVSTLEFEKAPIQNPVFTGIVSGDGGGISNITLQHVSDYGNVTSNTIQFTNTDVSLITLGKVGVNTNAIETGNVFEVNGKLFATQLFAEGTEFNNNGKNKMTGNTSIYGNLQVYGNLTYLESNTVFIQDPILGIGNPGATDSGVICMSGGPGMNVAFGYNNTLDEFIIAHTNDGPEGLTLVPDETRDLNVHVFGTLYSANGFGVSNTNPYSPVYALSVGSNIFAKHDGDLISLRNFADNGIYTTDITTPKVRTDSGALTLDANATVVTGNLIVQGDVTYVQSTEVKIDDPVLDLANNNSVSATDVGLRLNRPNANVIVAYKGVDEKLVIAHSTTNLSVDQTKVMNVEIMGSLFLDQTLNVGANVFISEPGVVTANSFIGDGGLLSNISSTLQDLTENGAESDITIVLTNPTGLDLSGNALVAGNVTAGVFYGDGQYLANVSNTANVTLVVTDLADNASRISVLETDLADNNTRVSTLETDLADNSARVSTLETYATDNSARVSVLETDLADNNARVSVLETDLADNNARVSTLETYASSNSARVSVLETDLADNNARVSTLETDLADNNARVSTLETYASSNSARVSVLETDLADNSARVSTLETDLTDNSARVSTLETYASSNSARVSVLETDLADNSARVSTLETDLSDNSARVSTLETYASSNSARVSVLETDLADNAARVSTLETDLTDNSARVTTLETYASSNSARVSVLETDLADNSSRIDVVITDLADNAARVSTLESDKANLLDPTFDSNITVSNNIFMTDLTASRVVLVGDNNELTDSAALTFASSLLTVDGDVNVSGNLIVEGSVTQLTTENTIVNDAIVELANNNVSDTLDMGIIMTRPSSNVAIGYRGNESEFMIGHTLSDPSSTDIVPDEANALAVHVYGELTSTGLDVHGSANVGALTTTGITMESTDGGSAAGPELVMWRNSATPSNGDYLGQIKFTGENDDGGQVHYAKITGKIGDAGLNAEDGIIEVAVQNNSYMNIIARFTANDLKLINNTGLEVAGDVSVDTDTFVVDVSRSNVGIGTNAPLFELDVHGDANAHTLNVSTIQGLQTLSFESLNTTTPPLQLTAGSLNDGVGALRIDSVEPDIFLNDTDGGFATVTFANNDVSRTAFGRNSGDDFYITVRDPSANSGNWRDDTLVADSSTGNISLGYKLVVNGATHTGSNVLDVFGAANAEAYYGDGGFLSNLATNLQEVTERGNTTDQVVSFLNPTTALTTDLAANVVVKLDQLSNVEFGTLAANEALVYDGANWVNEEMGIKNYIRVHNNTGSQLDRGEAVYIYNSWNNNVANVALAQSDSPDTMPAIGLMSESVTTGNEGYAVAYGKVNNVDTSAFNEGDTLYVSNTTPGGLSNVKPYDTTNPDLIQNIGICIKKGASGIVFVTGVGRANDIPNAQIVTSNGDLNYVYVNDADNDMKKIDPTNLLTKIQTLEQVTNAGNTSTLTIELSNATGISASGNVHANQFYGDGQFLSNIANISILESNVDLKADLLDPEFTSNITVSNNVVVHGGTVVNYDTVPYKKYGYASTMTNSNVGVTFTSDVFYAKIIAQLVEGYSNVSTLVLEMQGGKKSGGGTAQDIQIGTLNKFGFETNPYAWSSTVTTTPTKVVMEPTQAGTTDYSYSLSIEYMTSTAGGQVESVDEGGSAVATFTY